MPKAPQPKPAPGTLSPWAYVLTDYAWNRRAPNERPRTAGQIATRIGQRRQTVYSWFEGTTPDVHTLFAVMAQLNIPLERLAAGYAQAGLPFPPLTEAEAAQRAAAPSEERSNTPPQPAGLTAAPSHSTPTPAATPAPPDSWDSMIASTVASLHELGIPDAAIDATVERIRATQAGHAQPPATQRHITAEHTDPEPQLEPEPESGEADQQQQQQPPRRSSAVRPTNPGTAR
ncbi:MAG TPA: helix-turn-helix transcriptional regulator [Ktedonobacterales bacterium]